MRRLITCRGSGVFSDGVHRGGTHDGRRSPAAARAPGHDRELAGQRAQRLVAGAAHLQDVTRRVERRGGHRAPRDRRATVLAAGSGLDEAAGDHGEDGGDRRRRSCGTASTGPTVRRRARPACRTAPIKTAADALAAFRKLRATMHEYAQGTSEDLRSRKLLEGNMDVYQWFLMISTHSQRHILQIREIKAAAGFPKS